MSRVANEALIVRYTNIWHANCSILLCAYHCNLWELFPIVCIQLYHTSIVSASDYSCSGWYLCRCTNHLSTEVTGGGSRSLFWGTCQSTCSSEWTSRSEPPSDAHCSDELAAAHYRLAHAGLMVVLWPTTEPNHIFNLNYDWLKVCYGWSYSVCNIFYP